MIKKSIIIFTMFILLFSQASLVNSLATGPGGIGVPQFPASVTIQPNIIPQNYIGTVVVTIQSSLRNVQVIHHQKRPGSNAFIPLPVVNDLTGNDRTDSNGRFVQTFRFNDDRNSDGSFFYTIGLYQSIFRVGPTQLPIQDFRIGAVSTLPSPIPTPPPGEQPIPTPSPEPTPPPGTPAPTEPTMNIAPNTVQLNSNVNVVLDVNNVQANALITEYYSVDQNGQRTLLTTRNELNTANPERTSNEGRYRQTFSVASFPVGTYTYWFRVGDISLRADLTITPQPTPPPIPPTNNPPEVTIIFPRNNQQIPLDLAFFLLEGRAIDIEDGPIPDNNLIWSIDGNEVGRGNYLTVTERGYRSIRITQGTHTVTLTATDSDGNQGQDTVTFTYGTPTPTPPSIATITLNPTSIPRNYAGTVIVEIFRAPANTQIRHQQLMPNSNTQTLIPTNTITGNDRTDANGRYREIFFFGGNSIAAGNYISTYTIGSTVLRETLHVTSVVQPSPGANTPPRIAIPDQQIVSAVASVNHQIDLFTYAQDDQTPDERLRFSIEHLNPLGTRCSINGRFLNCLVTGFGSSSFRVTVTDEGGLSATDDFAINLIFPGVPGPVPPTPTVTTPPGPSPPGPTTNNAPVWSTIPNQVLTQAGLNNNIIDLHQFVADETPDAQLTYLIVSESNTNVVDCSLDSNRFIDCNTITNGNSLVTVRATDPQNLQSQTSFTVTVNVPSLPPPGVLPTSQLTKQHRFALAARLSDFTMHNPGDEFESYVKIKNTGNLKEKNMQLSVIVPELYINEIVANNFNLDPYQTRWATISFNIPSDARQGEYVARVIADGKTFDTSGYLTFHVQ